MQRRQGDSAMSRPVNATKDKTMREDDLRPLEKKYIEVQYDSVTQGYLREYCNEHGFDLSIRFDGSTQDPDRFDFHSTVWFTTTEHDIPNRSHPVNVTARAKNFALFGSNQDILVLEIESEDLEQLREHYGSTYNMEDEWPDYRPHITLCYRYAGDGIPDIALPEKDLVANVLNIKKQIS